MEESDLFICEHCNLEITEDESVTCYCSVQQCLDCYRYIDICRDIEENEEMVKDFFSKEFEQFKSFQHFSKEDFLKEKKQEIIENINNNINHYKIYHDKIIENIDIEFIYNELYEKFFREEINDIKKHFLLVFHRCPSFQKIYDNDIPRNILEYIL